MDTLLNIHSLNTMGTTMFALVSLTIFVLIEVYNARHLHGVSIKESWPQSELAVIQMVNEEEKPQLLQSTPLSSSYAYATYSRVPKPPPPPPKGQATYVRVNPPPPPSPDDGPPPIIPTSYLNDKPNSNNESYNVAIEESKGVSIKESWPQSEVAVIQMVNVEEKPQLLQSTPLSSFYEHATYSRVPKPPPLPPKGQATYVRVNPPPPPSKPDDEPPSIIPTSYLNDKPNSNNENYNVAIEESKGFLVVEVSPKQDSSMGQTKHRQDDPRTLLSPDPNNSQVPGMYDQVNPSAPPVTEPAHPKQPLLSDGGSACTGLSANLSSSKAPFMLLSYITRVFKYWG